ncbi:MAG TPA: hypothetical protein PKE32_05860 [Miltoncostaeaceae bacterium]|nr:hypothetical protein [Miltoncostaeaceae bacterium]
MTTARERDGQDEDAPDASSGSSLYAEMLPLVEAGATVEQAARRFGGDAGEAQEIAEDFLRWWEAEARDDASDDEDDDDDDIARDDDADDDEVDELRSRVARLEAENRALRRRMADLREVIRRAGELVEANG